MDGENNGKPYFLMDDLGVKPTIFGNIQIQGGYCVVLPLAALLSKGKAYSSVPICEMGEVNDFYTLSATLPC